MPVHDRETRGCLDNGDRGLRMSDSAARSEALVREYLAGLVEGDVDRSLLAADFVSHLPSTMGTEGLTVDQRESAVRLYRSACPDLSVEYEVIVATADTVVATLAMSGTHRGEPLPVDGRLERMVDPDGATIDLQGVAIFSVEDGSIARVDNYVDKLQLLDQLDVIPS